MRLFTFLSLILFTTSAISQSLLEYEGPFKNGEAKYSYLESAANQRKFQGRFTYTATEEVANRGESEITVTGNYENDQKNLAWAVTIKSEELTETVIGQYKNGMKTGVWTHRLSAVDGSRDYKSAQASFFDNRFRNKFTYDYQSLEPESEIQKISITGSFDSDGKMDGEWIVQTTDMDSTVEEDKMVYKHGLFVSRIKRNLIKDVVILEESNAEAANAFFENMNRKDSSSVVDGKKVGLKAKRIEHELLTPILSTWVDFDNIPITNRFNSPIPTAIVERGEIKATKALNCQVEFIDWAKTEKGQAEIAEKERMEEAYNNKIKLGDGQMEQENYPNAIRIYEEALKLKPSESYPKEKIAEAKEIMDLKKKKEMLSRRIDNEYGIFKDNDGKMKNEDFFRGKKHLFEAATILFDHKRKELLSNNRDVRTELQRENLDGLTVEQMEGYIKDLEEITKLQKKVMELIIQDDTKDIEKELKKMDTPQQIQMRLEGVSGEKI